MPRVLFQNYFPPLALVRGKQFSPGRELNSLGTVPSRSASPAGTASAEEVGGPRAGARRREWAGRPPRESAIPEVLAGRPHAPVPGRAAWARGEARLGPGGRADGEGHHAAAAERRGQPAHRHHPRSDLG